jgi:maltooligosyltrehalose synthase
MRKKNTFRVNVNARQGITFAELERRLPTYERLKIRWLYLSPFLTVNPPEETSDARLDHGYNPCSTEVDPRLGGMSGFLALSKAAKLRGIEICADVVHHMSRRGNSRFDDLSQRHLFFFAEAGEGGDCLGYAGFNEYVGVNTSNPDACAWFYEPIVQLAQQGAIAMARVDFVEGVGDPHKLSAWLSHHTGGLPILVELTRRPGQKLPYYVAGTTGGEVIRNLFQAFINGGGLEKIVKEGVNRTGSSLTLAEHAQAIARETLHQDWFRCHVLRLARLLKQLDGPEVTVDQLVEGLLYFQEVIQPNYGAGREDPGEDSLTEEDRELIQGSLFSKEMQDVLLLEMDRSFDPWVELFWKIVANLRCLAFRVAGGYDLRYWPAYEGGLGADTPAISLEELHRRVIDQKELAPLTLLADCTHDTIFGPRQRAAAAAITHHAPLFLASAKRWRELLAEAGSAEVPGEEIEWLVLTILAVLPMDKGAGGTPTLYNIDHVFDLVVRTAREGKRRTNWLEFDEKYETALRKWLAAAYGNRPFVDALAQFHNEIDPLAETFALAWVLLRILPGHPHAEETQLGGGVLLRDPHNRARVEIDPLTALVESFQAGQDPTRENAYTWLIWRVFQETARLELDDYRPVSLKDGVFAFTAGNCFVCVPTTPQAKHLRPQGDGWQDVIPTLRGLHPAYEALGLYVRNT